MSTDGNIQNAWGILVETIRGGGVAGYSGTNAGYNCHKIIKAHKKNLE